MSECIQSGDRVLIVIPDENVKFGCDQVYPQGGTGTIMDYVDSQGKNWGCYNSHEGLAYVKLDKPFVRTALVNKPTRTTHTWVPCGSRLGAWLLFPEEREKPAELDDMSALIRQVEHYDPDDVPYEAES